MQLDFYAKNIKQFAVYPKDQELTYLALGLGNEAGEFQGKVKKLIRDYGLTHLATEADWDTQMEQKYNELVAELGDVFWYLAMLCNHLDIAPEHVLELNYSKLASRKDRGVLKGSGDNR